jgi:hypothetical protein
MLHCIARRDGENIEENAQFRLESAPPRMYVQAGSAALARLSKAPGPATRPWQKRSILKCEATHVRCELPLLALEVC